MRVAVAADEDRAEQLSEYLEDLDVHCEVLPSNEQSEYSTPVYELVIATLPVDHRVSAGEQLLIIADRDQREQALDALEGGAESYILEPVSARELRIKVEKALEEGAREKTFDEHVRAGEKLIYRLITASQIRGIETEGHLLRVTQHAKILARELGWRESNIAALQWAAPLHDIGKLAIPKDILLKSGDLTDDEWETMKAHTEIGGMILSEGTEEFKVFRLARDIALQHHEHWDGNGYPKGLKGEDISEAARIVAVANTFDAVTHSRSYRDDWSLEKAEEMIASESGKYFDPRVVEAFQARQLAIRQIHNTYGDRELAEWKKAISGD